MRLNKKAQKELEAYRKANGKEIFWTRECTYDIVAAQFLIERDGREAEQVWVDPLASEMFRTCPPIDQDGYISYPGCLIDYKHAMSELDLNKPLIFNSKGQLIDGHHRLYRANCLGISKLPAHTLTKEEESFIC